MDSYPNRPLPVRPRPKPIADMTDQELTEMLTTSRIYGDLIPGLIEYVFRQDREIKAKKNQLRNRYKRYKEKQKLKKEETNCGNC